MRITFCSTIALDRMLRSLQKLVMPSLFSLRSRLSEELMEYLEEQCRDSAALAAYFPPHLRASGSNGKTGFDGVRQKVHVRTSQRDRIVDPKEGIPVYDPIGSRPERQHLDYFGHEEREERKPVAWDDTAGDQFRRAVILGDPGYPYTPNDGRKDYDGWSGRVVRGGAWYRVNPGELLVTTRVNRDPGLRLSFIGFRCVVVGGSSR